jgi:hypothetical protein
MENQLTHLESCIAALTSEFEVVFAENQSLAAEVKRLNENNLALVKQHDEAIGNLKLAHQDQVDALNKESTMQLLALEDKNELLRTTLLDSADAIKALLLRLPKIIQEEIEK